MRKLGRVALDHPVKAKRHPKVYGSFADWMDCAAAAIFRIGSPTPMVRCMGSNMFTHASVFSYSERMHLLMSAAFSGGSTT